MPKKEKSMKRFEINNRRYLGSKYKLLEYLDEIIRDNNITFKTFFDIFGGTGVVAKHYAEQGKVVYVNDILLSNYYAYLAWFDSQPISKRKLKQYIREFNHKKHWEDNYFSEQFADTYFTKEDCKKIGFIRESIEQYYQEKKLNERERAYLITALIYSMDRIANTVGHYDAYRKKENLESEFVLYELNVEDKPSKKNRLFHEDANTAISKVRSDVLFVDMPYNSRQYGDAYHLLENVAEWKKPQVYGEARKMNRDHLKSDYCMKRAAIAFRELIEQASCQYIIVTYNNMGLQGNERSQAKITDTEMLEILERKGKVKVYEKEYTYYNTGKTALDSHTERVFVCMVNKGRCGTTQTERLILEKKRGGFVKSPLNYVGGKYRLLPQLLKEFPDDIDTFVDCCCGGCNVGVNSNAKKIVCVDHNKNVIDIFHLFEKYSYMELVLKIERVIEEFGLSNTLLNSYEYYGCDSSKGLGTYNRIPYLKLRETYNKKKDSEERLFLLLTLIFYSFNHQIRFNSNKEFNIPVGKRDFNNSIRRNLLAFCERIKQLNITFQNKDFRKISIKELGKSDFFYADPPYLIADAIYNEGDGAWTLEDEMDLLAMLDKMNKRGIRFALSNVMEHNGKKNNILAKWVEKNNYRIISLSHNYNNANYQSKSKQSPTKEVLIVNYHK